VRVLGIDPGTISIDLCGIDDGRVVIDRAIPTADALADPRALVAAIEAEGPFDLVAGPSGYGLPLIAAHAATETDIRLACLAAGGEAGGIGGLAALMRALGRSSLPVVFTPGVVHLPTVPPHRKINRVDLGTADKVCAAALAIHEHAARTGCEWSDVDLVLLELGGAFSAALSILGGQIVDGAGGSAGPMGLRAPGSLDGEVAFLAGSIGKDRIFNGGAAAVAGRPDASADQLSRADDPAGRLAWRAYIESAVKAVLSMLVSVPRPREIVLSGRAGHVPAVRDELARHLAPHAGGAAVRVLTGIADVSTRAAQGAALLADGLAGGANAGLVETLAIRRSSGTVFDHLSVIAPAAARRRIGLADS
jgi:predicted butyrate kinase (DUF1464 family)